MSAKPLEAGAGPLVLACFSVGMVFAITNVSLFGLLTAQIIYLLFCCLAVAWILTRKPMNGR